MQRLDPPSNALVARDYSNMIVAFGSTDTEYFICAGSRTEESQVSHEFSLVIASKLSSPIISVAFGTGSPSGWFVVGYEPGRGDAEHNWFQLLPEVLNRELMAAIAKPNAPFIRGVSVGSRNAYAWWTDYECHYKSLGDLRRGWVEKMKLEYPNKRIEKIFLGANNATVVVWTDKTFAYFGVTNQLANVLSGAMNRDLRIRHFALSIANSAWFFVQFTDNSITWNTTNQLGSSVISFARASSFPMRKNDLSLEIFD